MSKYEQEQLNKMKGCAKGCSIGCLTVILLFFGLILTMCHVPSSKYKPYISAGHQYYRTVLNSDPKITHGFMYADEGGGFGITIEFSKNQMENSLTELYMREFTEKNSFSFRGSSTKSNIVGLTEKETTLLEKANEYSEFNQPVSKLLDKLLEDNTDGFDIQQLTNGGTIDIYSTDLIFWKNIIENYEWLKSRPFKERLQWLSNQTNNETYFYIRRYISLEEMSAGMLAKSILGYEEKIISTNLDEVFPKKIVQNFPVGSIFELKLETEVSRSLYQSNKNGNLVKSRYEYPVTY
ncbi:hypothetical protein [Enterococcus sp. 5H]|uniref:hypothetical protein n=1 Tax=Enterococcus sp. 5H TaxID=1229490 RepID=UPI00230389BF|nr:hypothetical protein [Enterococcus sp. 5H]MDA9472028.1 hypothetical protein [Enterococcus sp. 5H]